MKILFLEWKSFGNEYIKAEFLRCGHEVMTFPFPQNTEDTRGSEDLAARIATTILEKKAELVFSFNYFPVAAVACKACKVKYVSWTYDSPYIQLYSYTLEYPTNYAFIFDKAEYLRLKAAGMDTVYYLPMAAPTAYYETCVPTKEQRDKYQTQIAMIGSMYTEKKSLFRHLENLDEYTKGYLQAVMNTQKEIYGANLLEAAMRPDIIENVQKVCPLQKRGDGFESVEWVFANYFLARELTATERQEYVKELSERFEVTLYTPKETPALPKVRNMGAIDYYTEAPYAMKCAKINLNISLRSIVSGIPLRAWDIMGNGGFLMTNFQADFLDYFIPDEDFVYFESKADLLEKVSYYLTHEERRMEIAQNGLRKVQEHHTYQKRVEEMFAVINQ